MQKVKKPGDRLFFLIFVVIRPIISIGEITKNILVFPFKTFFSILKQFAKAVKRIKIPGMRLPEIRLPEIKLPVRKTEKEKSRQVYFWRREAAGVGSFFSTVGKGIIHLLIFVLRLTVKILIVLFINPFRSISIKIRYFFVGFAVCLVMVFANESYLFVKSLPSPSNIGKVNYPLSTHILDRNGKLLYEIYRDQNRTPVRLTDIPVYVTQATVAIEDKDFYYHQGISLVSGIFRAIKDSVISKSLQGGSTITQQLVKSALLTPERTVTRKIKEMILALWTERMFTKDQILEMYLNQVPYGGSAYGIEEASKTYFGKQAKDLTVSEAAFLAGLPQAPTLYSPYVNPELATERRNEVLDKMYEQKYIDENTKNTAKSEMLNLVPPRTKISAPHFVFYTKAKLEEEYGIKQVEEGGMRVVTSLDLDIQNDVEKILKEELDKIKYLNVTNGAVLITMPKTGEILAMVGSIDYFESPSGAFNVTTALRQPGSSIKPIMYSLALDRGYTAATIIDDSPVTFTTPGGPSYKPVNYDGKFHGKIPLRYALANSYNIPAVKTLNSLGVDNFVSQAKKMGISTWDDSSRFGLSLTLGGGEVTMVDMAKAYGVLANNGYREDINNILQISDPEGEKIYGLSQTKTRVIDPGISYIISDILSDNFARKWAFGSGSALEIPGYKVAVKTGTTDSKKDNWTVGYTPDFLVTVWVGNNDSSPMNPYLTSGITGAAPIWNRVMSYLLKKYPGKNQWYSQPDDVVTKQCYFGKAELFIKGTENKVGCSENLFNISPTPTPSP